MIINRKRWVIVRDGTDIFCGLARNYQFKPIKEIGHTPVKTYLSRNKAISAFESSYDDFDDVRYKAVEVSEIISNIDDTSVQSSGWTPFTLKYNEEEERQILTCPLPDDGQEILVTDGKTTWQDTFMSDGCDCWLDDSGDELVTEVKAWRHYRSHTGG